MNTKQITEDISLACDEIEQVRAWLLAVRDGRAILKELIRECYERNDRLGTALDCLEKYLPVEK